MRNTKFRIVTLVVLLGLLLAGCGPSEEEIAAQTATVEAKATSTAEVQATATAETQATATAEVQATVTAQATERVYDGWVIKVLDAREAFQYGDSRPYPGDILVIVTVRLENTTQGDKHLNSDQVVIIDSEGNSYERAITSMERDAGSTFVFDDDTMPADEQDVIIWVYPVSANAEDLKFQFLNASPIDLDL
jgi:hypothetical protein